MDKKSWIIILLVIIIIFISSLSIILLLYKKGKKGDKGYGGDTQGTKGCPNKKVVPHVKGIYPKGKYNIGGYIYPGSLPFEGWDPDNFSNMSYINVGNIYVINDLSINTENLQKNFTMDIIDKLKGNNIKILLSVFVNTDGVNFLPVTDPKNPCNPPIPSTECMWFQALDKAENVPILIDNFIKAADAFKSDGIDFDVEPIRPTPKNVQANFVSLVKGLKNRTLANGKPPLIGIALNDNASTKLNVNLPGINPYVDFVEIMCYFTENFPHDIENFPGIDKNKIILGLGLSSTSIIGVPIGTNPKCPGSTTITNDWGQVCKTPQNPDGFCQGGGVFPSWNEVNRDIPQYKYDFYLDKIRKGEAKYILSQATGSNGQRIPYLYFPGDKPSVIYFNGLDRVGKYAKTVIDNGYGGLFTWITSCDSHDGIFHRNMYEYLNLYPYLTCGGETANCDMDYLAKNYGWRYYDPSGNEKYSLGIVPPINDHDLNWRKNNKADPFVLLKDGGALNNKGILCDEGSYGSNCEYKYCGDWTRTHPNQVYNWPDANEMCPGGTSCNASSGNCE